MLDQCLNVLRNHIKKIFKLYSLDLVGNQFRRRITLNLKPMRRGTDNSMGTETNVGGGIWKMYVALGQYVYMMVLIPVEGKQLHLCRQWRNILQRYLILLSSRQVK